MTKLEQEELKKCSECCEVDRNSTESAAYWCNKCLDGMDEKEDDINRDNYAFLPIPFEDLGMVKRNEN